MGIYNPRQTIIVTCRDETIDDPVTLSWHSPLSHNPLLYGIMLSPKRKSLEIIKKSKEFCVNFLTEEQEDLALYCGTVSARNADKFKERNIGKEECETINCPKIADCSAYLECKATDFIEVGDHIIVVGEVKKQIEGNSKKKLLQSNITGPYTFTTTKD